MLKEEAERLAIEAVREQGSRIGSRSVWSEYFGENSRSDPRAGWLVAVPINVPKGIEADMIWVEVFEPNGEVNIRYAI